MEKPRNVAEQPKAKPMSLAWDEISRNKRDDASWVDSALSSVTAHCVAAEERLHSLRLDVMARVAEAAPLTAVLPWGNMTIELLEKTKGTEQANLAPLFHIGEFSHEQLKIEGVSEICFPAFVPIGRSKGLFVSTDSASRSGAERVIQSLCMRVALSLHADLCRFHLIDTATMGRAFTGLGGLDKRYLTSVATSHAAVTMILEKIEGRVADLNLRCLGMHNWLGEYNTHNPGEPEAFEFVCVSHFPAGFSDLSLEILSRLMAHDNAARAGIHIFMTGDENASEECGISHIPRILWRDHRFEFLDSSWVDTTSEGSQSFLEFIPETISVELLRDVVRLANSRTAPDRATSSEHIKAIDFWTQDSGRGISVPIGRSPRVPQHFTLGNGTIVHNALVGGAVGTGKTVLLHNIILHTAQLYSPEDVQFVVLDYKEGTEFAVYQALPHIRVLSIASELTFGLRVFEWLLAEKTRRADKFKETGVINLEEYRVRTGVAMPRLLVIIDEFQRLLASASVGFQISDLLDEVVRQGRSFGINLVLSTQSLADVNIKPSTLTQLVARICLRMGESDAAKFLSYDNLIPTQFSRPGQAVYNDSEGRSPGNSEFQVNLVTPEAVAEQCVELQEHERQCYGAPVIKSRTLFSGEELANPVDHAALLSRVPTDTLTALLGPAIEIDASPVGFTLSRTPGANVIIAAAEAELLGIVCCNILQQFLYNCPSLKAFVLDGTSRGKESERLAATKSVQYLSPRDRSWSVFDDLLTEMEERKSGEVDDAPPILLVLVDPHTLPAFDPVAAGPDPSPVARQVKQIADEGPRNGIHLIAATRRLDGRLSLALGGFTGRLDLQSFSARIAFRAESSNDLVDESMPLELGRYSGYLYDQQTQERKRAFRVYSRLPELPIPPSNTKTKTHK